MNRLPVLHVISGLASVVRAISRYALWFIVSAFIWHQILSIGESRFDSWSPPWGNYSEFWSSDRRLVGGLLIGFLLLPLMEIVVALDSRRWRTTRVWFVVCVLEGPILYYLTHGGGIDSFFYFLIIPWVFILCFAINGVVLGYRRSRKERAERHRNELALAETWIDPPEGNGLEPAE